MWGKQKPWRKNQEFYSSREVLLFCMRDWVISRERMHYMEQNSQPLKPLKTFWVTIDFVTSIFLNALRNQFDLDMPVIKYIFKMIRVFVLFLEMQQITDNALRSMRLPNHAFQHGKQRHSCEKSMYGWSYEIVSMHGATKAWSYEIVME